MPPIPHIYGGFLSDRDEKGRIAWRFEPWNAGRGAFTAGRAAPILPRAVAPRPTHRRSRREPRGILPPGCGEAIQNPRAGSTRRAERRQGPAPFWRAPPWGVSPTA